VTGQAPRSGQGLRLGAVPPPAEVSVLLARSGMANPWLCLRSELGAVTRLQETWLALDDRRVLVLARGGDGLELVSSIVVRDLEEVELVTGNGLATLVVRTGGATAPLFAFDNSLVAIASDLTALLRNAAATGGELSGLELSALLASTRGLRCARCGRPRLQRTAGCAFCLDRGRLLRRLLAYAGRERLRLVGMGVLMLLGMSLELLRPQLYRTFIDGLATPGGGHSPAAAILALAVLFVGQQLVSLTRARLAVRVGSGLTTQLQGDVFRHLNRLSLSFFDRHATGDLMARLQNDARQFQTFLVESLQFTVINALLIVGVSIMLVAMNPTLGLVVLIPLPCALLISRWTWRGLVHRFQGLWVAIARVSRFVNDSLSGIRVVKAFGREQAQGERFEALSAAARADSVRTDDIWQVVVASLALIMQVSLLLVWYLGAMAIQARRMTIGDLIAYLFYVGMLFGPLQMMSRLNDWMGRSLTAAARLLDILNTEPEVVDRPASRPLGRTRGELELVDVTFGYAPSRPVLKHVSLSVRSSEMIALVGASGAGKSTLVNIIGRMYDPDAGAVRLDGIDLRDIQLDSLRRQVAFVPQECFLFSASIAENIAYARTGATRREIIEAAMAADAHDFIMRLPDAYDSPAGERGQRLSGGERQRIAIARAILADPRILILDEATSNVDVEAEARIHRALRRLVVGRTTIAIAHRLSTIQLAARIVVLKDGAIVEQGTHEELVAIEGGTYQGLVKAQFELSRVVAVGG
jgi:ATP-binding cassette, subfamily B, bacterial